MFGIDQTGSIFVNGTIDRERVQSPITVTVEAVNSQSAVPLFATADVSIIVEDVNDNAPRITIDPAEMFEAPEVSVSFVVATCIDCIGTIHGLSIKLASNGVCQGSIALQLYCFVCILR